MDFHVLYAVAVVAAFALGVFVAPKLKTAEDTLFGEVHALYSAGALEVEHVVSYHEAQTAQVKASAAKDLAHAQAMLAAIPKAVVADVVVVKDDAEAAVADVAKKV